ncbi:MAG: TIGR03013 family PEP-CTERM/XrtA system glycosyltransferase [Alphaproteobacteria bacterium]|nr:TIGR03013 family PEP-CTERM/XrtA system glycosyltransferase [Alphaproteobacteria bacterium]
MFRHHMAYSSLLLAIIEGAIVFWIAFAFSDVNFAEFMHDAGSLDEQIGVAALSVSCLLLLMAGFGLYNPNHFIDYRDMFGRMIFAFAASVPVFFFVFYVFSSMAFSVARIWHTSFLLTLILTLVCVGSVRVLYMLVADMNALKRRILVYGVGEQAARMLQFYEARKQLRFVIAGFIRADNEPPRIDTELILPSLDGVLPVAREHRVDEIVVAVRERRGLPVDDLLEARMHGIKVTEFSSFFERESGQVEIEGLYPSWLIYCDGFRVGVVQNAMKRGFDVAVSLAFLILTLPLLIATAIAIKLESRGPVFYRQDRVGMDGRPYALLKFRSMREDAEQDGVPRWAAIGDSRITRVGGFIRTTRIDELPQIFCVLRGDMSFIGPRPERPYFVNELIEQLPYYGQRHRVRPGISGWAQINYPYGASVEDARAKLTYDLYYIKNYSIFLDMIILIETIRVVLWPRGVR